MMLGSVIKYFWKLKSALSLVVLIVFGIVNSWTAIGQTSNEDSAIQEINSMLNEWHGLAAVGDSTFFDRFDNESFYLGTDAKEIWTLQEFKDFALPYFKRGSAWSFKTKSRNVYLGTYGNYAWSDEVLDTWMGLCRGTCVMEKKEKHWVIKHYSLTVLVSNKLIKDYVKLLDQN